MGRTRTKASKKAAKAALTTSTTSTTSTTNPTPPSQPTTSQSTPSVPSLLTKAQSLIVQCSYPLARRFIERALAADPAHPAAREMLGVVLLEMGEVEGARETFQSLLPPHPNAPAHPPPAAHLYLAQLSEDDPHAALAHYLAAIDILHAQLEGKTPSLSPRRDDGLDESESEIRTNIVRVYVGMVEIWMDPSYDLCFDPAAESTCESLLARALDVDPSNPEALLALASVRTSQQRPDEALALLRQSHAAMQGQSHAAMQGQSPAEAPSNADEPDTHAHTPLSTRLALAKMFIELGAYAEALGVLQGVLAADDGEVEAWYLQGWAFWLMGERAREGGGGEGEGEEELGWEELWRDARDCLETCRALHIAQDHPDAPLLEHVQELLGRLDQAGIEASPVDMDADGEGWEDDDGDASDGDEDGDASDGDGDVEME
ncbi:hypothetical protein BJ138DRAFT_1092322 [Hygrophoropsis aurantiaca]|uniref:Uncharacterized protein n=1 Tax=Hygrophoropsis aurantiaca TaxID=72124 RepID=A0ACB8A3F8_9AGAM|nr:hypothetical protein BJ138DRAFT_1092322 [Hygrophoropsis aurantiaca]